MPKKISLTPKLGKQEPLFAAPKPLPSEKQRKAKSKQPAKPVIDLTVAFIKPKRGMK